MNQFLVRLLKWFALSAAVVMIALGVGVSGYHYVGGLPWIDALLNSAMILTGMGPVDHMTTSAAKLFSAAFALFSGIVFLSATSISLAPIVHRIMHRLHFDETDLE